MRSDRLDQGKKEHVNKKWEEIGSKLERTLNQQVSMEQGVGIATNYRRTKTQELDSLRREQTTNAAQNDQLKQQTDQLKQQTAAKATQLQKRRSKVANALATAQLPADSKFDDIIKTKTDEIQMFKDELASASGGAVLYRRLLMEAEKINTAGAGCHGCSLCQRTFGSPDEFRGYKQLLEREIAKFQSGENEMRLQEQIKTKERMLGYLKKNQQASDDANRLESEVEELDQQLAQKGASLETLAAAIEQLGPRIERADAEEKVAKSLEM
eukprot:SAG22_NODE_1060_length_5764_cov_2.176876_5_plen_269_part_00